MEKCKVCGGQTYKLLMRATYPSNIIETIYYLCLDCGQERYEEGSAEWAEWRENVKKSKD